MGRKIKVDIDNLFAILGALKDGGYSIPHDVFSIIGNCNLKDIDTFAKIQGADYGYVKEELIGMFKGYVADEIIRKERELKEI